MVIDARGKAHPEHLKMLKNRLAGLCWVGEDVEVLIDKRKRELKMLELYVRTFKCSYVVNEEGAQIRFTIKGPFNICGF